MITTGKANERTNERTTERVNERTSERANERPSVRDERVNVKSPTISAFREVGS